MGPELRYEQLQILPVVDSQQFGGVALDVSPVVCVQPFGGAEPDDCPSGDAGDGAAVLRGASYGGRRVRGF